MKVQITGTGLSHIYNCQSATLQKSVAISSISQTETDNEFGNKGEEDSLFFYRCSVSLNIFVIGNSDNLLTQTDYPDLQRKIGLSVKIRTYNSLCRP